MGFNRKDFPPLVISHYVVGGGMDNEGRSKGNTRRQTQQDERVLYLERRSCAPKQQRTAK